MRWDNAIIDWLIITDKWFVFIIIRFVYNGLIDGYGKLKLKGKIICMCNWFNDW